MKPIRKSSYAEQKQEHRRQQTRILSRRIIRPVKEDVAEIIINGSQHRHLRTRTAVSLAVLIHVLVVGWAVLSGGYVSEVSERPSEQFVWMETAPAPKEPASEPEPEIEPEVDLDPEPEPEPAPPPRQRRIPPPDPVTPPPEEPPPAVTPRRVVGISLSSTVQGGDGPAFAIGDTRMGETETIAVDPNAANRSPRDDGSFARGSGNGNREASVIPGTQREVLKPRRITGVEPTYPGHLKQRGIEGTVVVLVVIDIEGRVQRVRVLQSSGYPEFDEAAREAAVRDIYSPATANGNAIEYRLRYTYRFRIRGA